MCVCGIIAEYDPFHTGHVRQITAVREALGDCAVVCVMSGNWTQRGAPAIAEKHLRAKLALLGGADLVLELPTVWAASTAESFARGGVALLEGTGVVTHICFGSECGDVGRLRQVAQCLDSPVYHAGLRRFLDEGMPFAACRQAAVEGLLGEDLASLLSTPNSNLGVEYLRSLNALNSKIEPFTVRRQGALHGEGPKDGCASGSWLRALLREDRWEETAPYLLPGEGELLAASPLADFRLAERAVLARLRTMTEDDWTALPDSGEAEGLPQRLARAGQSCASLEEFFELAKTKRYPRARLDRLVLWAFLGLTAADIPKSPPYLRVLGFHERGREVLREMKDRAALPILTKPAHARELDEPGRHLFELEARCTDLYGLCLPQVPPGGAEWLRGPTRL